MKLTGSRSRPWRIAVITPRFTRVGGGERYCVETCRFLAQMPEIELTVICEELVDMLPGVRFIEIGRRDFPRFLKKERFAKKVQQVLEKEKFDLIHSHQQVPGANVCSLHGTPHASWVALVKKKRYPSLFDRKLIALEQQMLTSPECRALLPVSTLVQDAYAQVYDITSMKVGLAPPGIDEQWLVGNQIEEADRLEKRQELGFAKNDFVVSFVSMNWPHKGLDLLIRVLHRLKQEKGLSAKLLVVGKGDEVSYRCKAEKAGVDVVFAGVVREDMFDLYTACDVFALPSKWDAFAMVVAEAMSAGLPVVIGDQVGAKDVVVDGINGFVVQGLEESRWCDVIGTISCDPALRVDMGRAARETVRKLTWQHTANQILKTYAALLNSVS